MKKYVLIVLALMAMISHGISQIIHVPDDRLTIQAGIDHASAGDTILVAEGSYLENINFMGKAITVASHFLLDGDTSHISKTIIDGSQPTHPDSASVVTFLSGEDTTSVLTGFTITGGSGTLLRENYFDLPPGCKVGGGIFVGESGARINQNIIEANRIVHPSSYAHMDELFDSLAFGAGIAAYVFGEHNLIIEKNVIQNNHIESGNMGIGGGIFIGGGVKGKVDVNSNDIRGNIIETEYGMAIGGGIDYHHDPDHTIGAHEIRFRNNIIAQNKAIGNPDSELLGKLAFAGGGGMFINETRGNVNLSITNNILWENYCNYKGGGITFELSVIDMINNTFWNNFAEKEGNSLWIRRYDNGGATGILINNLLWSEHASTSEIDKDWGCAVYAINNNIKGGWPGENMDAEPMVDEKTFELTEGSPCIGTGIDSVEVNGSWYSAPPRDYYGNNRPHPMDHRVDMGAIESPFQGYVYIPDTAFLHALIDAKVDSNGDSLISFDEAEIVIKIDVNDRGSISDLTGIEAFVNLEKLQCDGNQLTSLDLSKNINLLDLSCRHNQLNNLDVTKNTALSGLWCTSNQLTSLDVSNCPHLSGALIWTPGLDCSNNLLTSLDLSNNTELSLLSCGNNLLTSLDLSKNDSLRTIYCQNNQLTSLDFSNNPEMFMINCENNLLTSMDISYNSALRNLNCSNNLLTKVDISNNMSLASILMSNMPSLEQVCVWTIPFPPEDVTIDTTGSPNANFTQDCVIGLDERQPDRISIYPNPTASQLTVETALSKHYQIQISTLKGQMILREDFKGLTHHIDLSLFQSGVYFITIRSKEFIHTRKIMKL